ncbi:MAG: Acetylornithine aminotransferase [Archaeoglobus fulgidus]|uniref:Acetylornithine aminotransferase n=1 Tax=Archaeoglobus fulgidus TaxID=2234 RepID=A0A101E2V0_ARCFL|nr:acetylornithine/succinylornithine family transaminase [Archaeoglobus fulgidus]KUJ94624.1 MAG: Acetylornithine aminotransferase [Archaeoglobus fulgidus]KUK07472.1 MAG: Acetylornithine aminotransferase [Archaeoglobus fulgidus]
MDWIEREKKHILQTYTRQKVVIERGEGCYVYDVNGKRYLDLVAGIATVSIGHCNRHLVERLKEQLEKLIHISNLYYTTPQVELAEKLSEIAGMDRFFFCNSGAEAVEAALKFARRATGRKKFVSFTGDFHGRTMGALSVTHKEKFRKPFEPLVSPVEFAEFNNPESLEKVVDEETAAVIVELVQGEAGVYPADREFVKAIEELREKYGFLLIVDEVQTGFGRTGRWFAKDHYGIEPDMITMAKAMGSGVPIGCCALKEEVAEKIQVGDHGSTFGGNPLACTAALATIEVIEREGLVENSARMGEYFVKRLKESFENVIGVGLMIGFDVGDAAEFVRKCLENGLLVNNTSERRIRLVPPLVITEREVDKAVEIMLN